MSSSTSQTQPFNPNPPNYVDGTELSPAHYGKPYILSRVFDMLILMIDVLQRTAAAQANRLNFLTEWQKAYTDELNQIHSFVANNGDQQYTQSIAQGDAPNGATSPPRNPVDKGGSGAGGSARADLNALNSIYTQEIQGNLNVISNDAKALQSNVNQSNDAVQSQSDMATSILQQLSTILTSIYQAA